MFILQDSIRGLPFAITKSIQAVVSVKRIQKLIDLPDMVPIEKAESSKFCNSSFSYGATEVLRNLSLSVVPGEFLAVVGPVGSGKSSLLHALMGEIPLTSGRYWVDSELSYSPSLDSWLINDTLRNNILLGNAFREEWYWKVVGACGLLPDIEILPGKDLTEIGEKGINLSGGQKARVNLARAVYANTRTILLDDPLSSVDTHVAKHIFEQCFCKLLQGKTRVMVTHRLEFLSKVDRVLIMEGGGIREIKSPGELTVTPQDTEQPQEQPQEQHAEGKGPHRIIEEEDRKTGRVHKEVYWSYFNHSESPWSFVLAVLIMLLWTITLVLGDVFLKEWSEGGSDVYMNLYIIVKLGGSIFILFRCLLMYLAIGCRVSKRIHEKMLDSLLRAPVNLFYDVTPTGRVLNRLSKDQQELDDEMPGLIGSFLAVTSITAAILCIQYWYFPYLLVFLPLLVYISVKFAELYLAAVRELRRMESLCKSQILNLFGECVSGAKFIRCFQKKEFFLDKNYSALDENTKISYNMAGCLSWLILSLGALSSVFVTAILVLIIVLRDYVTVGMMGLCLTYSLVLPDCIIWNIFIFTEIEKNMISVERIHSYIQLTPELPTVMPADRSDWPTVPSIKFMKVCLRYRPNTPLILKELTFEVRPGERVGIVGRTGSGKSSTFLALLRLVELSRGAIFIDGTNIASLGLHSLRRAITLIPQDPMVFEDTLRANLDPRGGATEEQTRQILGQIQLSSFELTHEIKGKGTNLSVGERQLISIGRALLTHTKILLLDEATAGIDSETDKVIQTLIRERFTGCSILVIAHRLETILDSDQIIVLENGELAEIGTPQELSSRGTLFSNLVTSAH